VIEALWIFEVPMALPLDARVPEEELKRARRALKRAKAVGEEYEGVEVATAVVRARRAGEAIVHEAKRRGVEAIVLAAEEPARVGSSVATSALRAGHTVSVLDEDPLSHERLDVELGRSWEEAGGRFTIGTALEVDALLEAGIEEAEVFIASTNGDNTNLVVSQIAQRRFRIDRVIARVL